MSELRSHLIGPLPTVEHPPQALTDFPYVDGASVATASGMTRWDVDVVVIGSGPGGAAAAYHLIEQGVRVLLLEAGPAFKTSEFSQDLGKAYSQLYAEGGVATTELPPFIPLFRAEGLGGGSLVNSGLCFRPRPEILLRWQEISGAGWMGNLDEDFAWVESYMMIGPNTGVLGRNNTVLADAALKLGWQGAPAPRNAPTCIGCGACNLGCPSGGKRSTDVSYVRDAARAGLEVVTRAVVDRLILKKGQVVEVEGHFAGTDKKPTGQRFRVKADAYVLSTGALATPLILARSGYKNDHLGEHLHGHPGVGLHGWLYDEEVKQWDGVTQGYYVDEFGREGLLIETASLPAIAMSSAFAPFGAAGHAFMRDFRHVATIGGMIHDIGEGTVKIGFGGRAVRQYKPHPQDLERLKMAFRREADLFGALGVTKLQSTIVGAPPVNSRKELDKQIESVTDFQQLMTYISHAHGTTRMRARADEGVVGPDFKIHGLGNAYVADASVFPETLGVNPQVTIMAFSRMFARMLAGRLRI